MCCIKYQPMQHEMQHKNNKTAAIKTAADFPQPKKGMVII